MIWKTNTIFSGIKQLLWNISICFVTKTRKGIISLLFRSFLSMSYYKRRRKKIGYSNFCLVQYTTFVDFFLENENKRRLIVNPGIKCVVNALVGLINQCLCLYYTKYNNLVWSELYLDCINLNFNSTWIRKCKNWESN